MGDDVKVDGVLVLVGDAGRDAIAQVDLAAGKVEVLGVTVVREDIALEAEPVAVVLWVAPAALGQVARLGDFVLRWVSVKHTVTRIETEGLTAFLGR